jgi:hypothetical protein
MGECPRTSFVAYEGTGAGKAALPKTRGLLSFRSIAAPTVDPVLRGALDQLFAKVSHSTIRPMLAH